MRSSLAYALGALSFVCPTSASYAPTTEATNSTGVKLRSAGTPAQGNQHLSAAEAKYIAARRAKAPAVLKEFLSQNVTQGAWGGDLSAITNVTAPVIAIGMSGGGDRAALYGAALLNVFDSRNETSVEKGLGGLLQATSYISALSGGSWALMSFATNNFPQIYPMVLGSDNSSGWLLDFDLTAPGNSTQQTLFVQEAFESMQEKLAAGFPVTFADVWARSQSHHFVPGTTATNFFEQSASDGHGDNITFSSVKGLSSYKSHDLPFPIIVADAYSPANDNLTTFEMSAIPLQGVVYEFSPEEFGSYDPDLAHFISTSHLGTNMSNGLVADGKKVWGFDNAAWVTGASSNLFHAYNASGSVVWTAVVLPVVQQINATFYQPGQQLDISAVPNPFYGVNNGTYVDSDQTQLRLVDGGLDDQVDPIAPLAVPARGIELQIIFDAEADAETGTSILATAARYALLPNGTQSIPPLPTSLSTFTSNGFMQRPVFFGCNGTAASLNESTQEAPYPLMVYLPNYDVNGITNTTTLQTSYTSDQAVAFLDSANVNALKGIVDTNGTADAQWPLCMACAVVERMRGKTGVDRTQDCSQCFDRYCWDEQETASNATAPARARMARRDREVRVEVARRAVPTARKERKRLF